jgi:hypothetical protein
MRIFGRCDDKARLCSFNPSQMREAAGNSAASYAAYDLSRASRQSPFLRLKYIFSPHLPGPLLIMP